jgi:hypothetical protein
MNRKQTEWFILFLLVNLVSAYCLHLYTYSSNKSMYLIYIYVIGTLLSFISAAKSGLFNIFKIIRSFPKLVRYECWWILYDYKHWKVYRRRGKRFKQLKLKVM